MALGWFSGTPSTVAWPATRGPNDAEEWIHLSHTIKALAGASLLALSLTACSTGSGGDIFGEITWTEDESGVPVLEFEAPFSLPESDAQLVAEGDGAALVEGDLITLSYVVVDGADGSVVYSTYDTDAPESVELSEASFDPVLYEVLSDANVGSTLVYAPVSTTDTTAEGAALDTSTTQTFLMAVTVDSAQSVLSQAEGTVVDPVEGLPVVTLGDDGAPSVDIPATDPPTELVSQPLIEGGSDVVVELDDTITVHYTGWLWDGATEFDSSWDNAPVSFQLSEGYLIDGWTQGLVGYPVGSQVLLVVPSDLGYGDVDSGTIPGGSTLVFVVDILAAA